MENARTAFRRRRVAPVAGTIFGSVKGRWQWPGGPSLGRRAPLDAWNLPRIWRAPRRRLVLRSEAVLRYEALLR